MENDSILSLSTAVASKSSTVAAPSPVLDLIYSCYYLRGLKTASREPLEWATVLRRDEPRLTAAAAALSDQGDKGNALFAMALELDYAFDEDPRRFITDIPRLPELLAASHSPEPMEADAPSWMREPPDAAWAQAAADVVGELWGKLRPLWEASGRAAAQAAAQDVVSALEEHGDAMRAIPRRHFTQFESLSESLREAHARGTLRIVPLAFAEAGGFHLKGERVTAVGFGLHGERLFEATERRVAAAAERAKALADPTRLMLLNLITRYSTTPMTVGDLARQLGVTQPTVSGHLKLLRETGLITTERKGNRTFPKPNGSALMETVEALSEILRP